MGYIDTVMLAQPAAGTARARIRSAVRPSVLVAVLLGLFLMHGGPAAAGGGCHGGMRDTAVLQSGPVHDVMGAARAEQSMVAHPAEQPMAVHPVEQSTVAHPADSSLPSVHSMAADTKATAHAYADGAMPGMLCLATTPRSEIPPPPVAAAAFALAAVVLLPWARRAYGGSRRRGPPAGGRPLLLQVCIART
ncbi:hypothetical protein ACVB8X_21930 [Streptomyces sp. NRAIS4]